MIQDTAAQIDEILRNGGEFWIVEVTVTVEVEEP